MVLNNYRKFLVQQGMTDNSFYYVNYKSINGTQQTGFKATSNTRALRRFLSGASDQGLKMYVGTGTTAPTGDDYCLETPFSPSNFQFSFDTRYENGKLITDGIATGTNNTNSTVVISEIGISRQQLQNASASTIEVLFVRHVLDNPITVPNGESFRVTIEWIDE